MDILEKHYKDNFDRLSKQWGRRFDNQHIGQDVVQEAYLRAFKYRHTYDVNQKFDNWFGRIIHNAYKDIRNEEQGHSHEEIDEFDLEGIQNSHEVDRLMQQLIDKIDEEPEKYQEILRYHFVGGYSPKEISQFQDMSLRQVYRIIDNHKNKIRRMLDA